MAARPSSPLSAWLAGDIIRTSTALNTVYHHFGFEKPTDDPTSDYPLMFTLEMENLCTVLDQTSGAVARYVEQALQATAQERQEAVALVNECEAARSQVRAMIIDRWIPFFQRDENQRDYVAQLERCLAQHFPANGFNAAGGARSPDAPPQPALTPSPMRAAAPQRTNPNPLRSASMGIDPANPSDRTPLQEAALAGRLEDVRSLTRGSEVDLNACDSEGMTALHLAVAGGHLEVVRYLTRLPGVNPDVQSLQGISALHLAAGNGHVEVARHLMGLPRTMINAQGPEGATPLHWAAANGHLNMVQWLTSQRGIDLNPQGPHGSTPLHLAAKYGHAPIVQHLTGQPGIQVNAGGPGHATALHLAAAAGHLQVVQHLTAARGIDLNPRDGLRGVTPLHLAAENGRLQVVKHLTGLVRGVHGTNLQTMDWGNNTATALAASNGRSEVVLHLVQLPGARNECGALLNYAMENGNLGLTRSLYRLRLPGIDPNALLSFALQRNQLPIACFFIREEKIAIPSILFLSTCPPATRQAWLNALHFDIPCTVACDAIPDPVRRKAREIQELKKVLADKIKAKQIVTAPDSTWCEDPTSLEILELPVFDTSHRSEQDGLPALQQALAGWTEGTPLTEAQRAALTAHQHKRHFMDLEDSEGLLAIHRNGGPAINCPVCRHPEQAGGVPQGGVVPSIPYEFFRIDTDFQDRIITFLKAAVAPPAPPRATAPAPAPLQVPPPQPLGPPARAPLPSTAGAKKASNTSVYIEFIRNQVYSNRDVGPQNVECVRMDAGIIRGVSWNQGIQLVRLDGRWALPAWAEFEPAWLANPCDFAFKFITNDDPDRGWEQLEGNGNRYASPFKQF